MAYLDFHNTVLASIIKNKEIEMDRWILTNIGLYIPHVNYPVSKTQESEIKWTKGPIFYLGNADDLRYYYFRVSEDAMAFKIRWT